MAKAWLVLVVCVLGAPVLGLSAATVAESGGQDVHLLRTLCIVALALTVLIPSLYVSLAHVLARRREAFARFFPAIVRGTLFLLVTVFALQGALSLLGAFELAIADPSGHGAFLLVIAGGVFLYASLLVLSEGRNLFEPQAISVTGVKLSPHRLPGLHARVHRLAARLGVKAPERIILGLEPTCFVTSSAVNLRGAGELPAAPTLFLSTMALRALNNDEIDAVLGHELGHFRGDDLSFSQRFAPAFMSLTRALESVSIADDDEPAWTRLPRLPAIATLSGIMYVLYRAVSGISRQREFAADSAASEVAPRPSLVSALIKMQAISPYWENARRENASFVAQGKFRRNLAMDYLQGVRNRLHQSSDGDAVAALAESRTAHPLDTHPTMHERAAALGVEPNGLMAACLESLHLSRDHDDALGRIEQELTWIENDFVRPPVIPRPRRWSH
jgi:Zn-dependent protease with chaperone function